MEWRTRLMVGVILGMLLGGSLTHLYYESHYMDDYHIMKYSSLKMCIIANSCRMTTPMWIEFYEYHRRKDDEE